VQPDLPGAICTRALIPYSQINFQWLCNSLINRCVWYSAWFPPCFSENYDHTEKSVSLEGEVLLKRLLALPYCFFPTFFQTIGSCLCCEFGQRTKGTVFCSKNILLLFFIHSFFKMYSLLLLLYYLLQKLSDYINEFGISFAMITQMWGCIFRCPQNVFHTAISRGNSFKYA